MKFVGNSPARDWRSRDFDMVEAALLIPPDVPIRGGSRLDAAVVVDRELVKLAGAEGHARLVQARLVARGVEPHRHRTRVVAFVFRPS